MNPQTPQPDAQVLALTKAIRQKESGGNYGAVGDNGTSTGAYQYQPDTWKQYAKEILGNENAEMSEPNQNAVTYGKIKKWKDSGLGPAQIAAAWNAGEVRARDGSWANHKGVTKRNGKELAYDTPSYVKAVVDIYKQQAQGQAPTAPKQTFSDAFKGVQEQQPEVSAEPEKKEGLGKSLLKSLVKSPLTMLARPFQLGAELLGVSDEKVNRITKGIAGDFIAPTPQGAKDVLKDAGRALETASPAIAKLALTKSGLIGTKSALKSPEVVKMLSRYNYPASANVSRGQAIQRLTSELSRIPTSQVGGKTEQLILKALQELEPKLAGKSPSLIRKLLTGTGGLGALDLLGVKDLAEPLIRPMVGPLKEAVTGTGRFQP